MPKGMSVLVPFDDQVALTHWLDTNEVFIFQFGVIVVWGLSEAELDEFAEDVDWLKAVLAAYTKTYGEAQAGN